MSELTVERSLHEYDVGSASRVCMDPAVMAELDLRPGDLLRLSTFHQEILARVAEPIEDDRGSRRVRLNRLQRQALRVRIHGALEIACERERPTARVRIQPAVDLGSISAHHLEEHLKEELVENRAPVIAGALLFLHFHHSVSGTLYRIVEVEGQSGVVDASTDVVLDAAPDGFSSSLGLDLTFDDLGGMDREIRLIRELVQLPLKFPAIYRQLGIAPIRGLILYGPPGTGKTLLARATTNELDAQFYYINGPEIVGSTYGESEGNLRRIFGEAIHHSPSVIFIDELDAIAIRRGESGSHSDTRLVTQLLSLMDGVNRVDGVVVIGTTNRLDAIDVALRRPGRFDYELYIGAPDRAGREQILGVHTREMPLDHAARAFVPELAADTSGFVGADLMGLCRLAGLNALRRHLPAEGVDWSKAQQLAQTLHVQVEDLKAARRECRPSAARGTLVVAAEHGFAEVGGLAAAKAQLQVCLVTPLAGGQQSPQGVLLQGPSGAGKSLLARAVAKEAGASLILVSGPELFSKWLGETEEAVRHVFKLARELAPSLVFFDQLDAIAPIRGRGTGSWSTERVVHQILAELDKLNGARDVGVIAATNRVDQIDDALLQAGRFGMTITLALPEPVEREAILALHLNGVNRAVEPEALASLAQWTDGFSGAQLRMLAVYLKREIAALPDAQPVAWETLYHHWQHQTTQPASSAAEPAKGVASEHAHEHGHDHGHGHSHSHSHSHPQSHPQSHS
jgi:transitional endoplasmic reticulum ATPase